jgi:helix-turn-helix protein
VAGKRINPRLVKKHRLYLIGELAEALGVHKNTIRAWLNDGLCSVDGRRPMMFRGADIIAFLIKRRDKAKRPCPPGTMYCLRCRNPRGPAPGVVDCYRTNSSSCNLQAQCEACGAIMNRRVALDNISAVMPGIAVQFQLVPARLKESLNAPSNCDLGRGR